MNTIKVDTTIAGCQASYEMAIDPAVHKNGLRSLINGMPKDMQTYHLRNDIESNTHEHEKARAAHKYRLANMFKGYIRVANELIEEVQNDK